MQSGAGTLQSIVALWLVLLHGWLHGLCACHTSDLDLVLRVATLAVWVHRWVRRLSGMCLRSSINAWTGRPWIQSGNAGVNLQTCLFHTCLLWLVHTGFLLAFSGSGVCILLRPRFSDRAHSFQH